MGFGCFINSNTRVRKHLKIYIIMIIIKQAHGFLIELDERYKNLKGKKNCSNNWAGVRLKSNYLCWVYPKFPCLVCDTISTKEKKKIYIKMIVIVDILESMIVYAELWL